MQWSLYPEMLTFGIVSEKKGHVVTIHDIKTLSAHKKKPEGRSSSYTAVLHS